MDKKDSFTEPVHLLKQMFINGFKRGWNYRDQFKCEGDDLDSKLRAELRDIEQSFDSKESFFKFVLGL